MSFLSKKKEKWDNSSADNATFFIAFIQRNNLTKLWQWGMDHNQVSWKTFSASADNNKCLREVSICLTHSITFETGKFQHYYCVINGSTFYRWLFNRLPGSRGGYTLTETNSNNNQSSRDNSHYPRCFYNRYKHSSLFEETIINQVNKSFVFNVLLLFDIWMYYVA